MRNAEIAAALDELGVLYELDGADRLPRARLPGRGARRSARARSRSSELAAGGPADRAARRRQDARGEDRRAARDRRDPVGREAEGEVPRRRWSRSRGSRASARRRSRRLYDELGVTDLDDLRAAAEQRADPRGEGPRREGRGERARRRSSGSPTPATTPSGCCSPRSCRSPRSWRRRCASTRRRDQVEVAGSARRWAETCKDIDLIATADDPRGARRGPRRARAGRRRRARRAPDGRPAC